MRVLNFYLYFRPASPSPGEVLPLLQEGGGVGLGGRLGGGTQAAVCGQRPRTRAAEQDELRGHSLPDVQRPPPDLEPPDARRRQPEEALVSEAG